MNDNTSWTPSADDNKLGLTNKNLINEYEAKALGIAPEIITGESDENKKKNTKKKTTTKAKNKNPQNGKSKLDKFLEVVFLLAKEEEK